MTNVTRVTAHRRQRASARRHFRLGWRAAATRASTGAQWYLDKKVSTLAMAAACCGSNPKYIQAAVALIQDASGINPDPIEEVLLGRVPLLRAAAQAKRRQRASHFTVEEL